MTHYWDCGSGLVLRLAGIGVGFQSWYDTAYKTPYFVLFEEVASNCFKQWVFVLNPQVVCHQVQWLHGEDRPHRVRHAGFGVCLPPELLLLLRVRSPAKEGWRVCPERGSAALQNRLWEGERLTQLGQPGWLRLRWAPCTLSQQSENGTVVLSSFVTEVLHSVSSALHHMPRKMPSFRNWIPTYFSQKALLE